MRKKKKQGRAAHIAFQDKNRILQTVIQNGLGFLPSIFESAGFVHKETVAFFRRLSAHAEEEKKIPKATYPVQVYDDADVGLFAEASGAAIDEEGEYNQRT
jgi:hypothetical protein